MQTDRLKILLVEDDEDDYFLIREMLSGALLIRPELIWVRDGAGLLAAIADRNIDVCLLDYRLGPENGLDLLHRLTSVGHGVPVILLTGYGDRSVDVEAMKLGAADYLVKGRIDEDSLERSIRFAIEKKAVEEKLRRRNAELVQALEELGAAGEEIRDQHEALLRASKVIEEQRTRYEDLFQNAPDAYLVTDLDGRIRESNHAAWKCLNRSADDLLGKPLALFVAEDDKELFHNGLTRLKRLAHVEDWELRVQPKSGNPLDVSISTINIRDSYGAVSIRWLIRDISLRKRADEALQKSRSELKILSSRLLKAQEEERKRVAQELHDGIGSSLSATKLGMERALSEMEQGVCRPELLRTVLTITQDAIDEVRRIMTDLRPSVLDDLGLLATVGWFCRQYGAIHSHTAIQQKIEIREEEIPDPLKIVIFRIMQEALNNVAKHGRADLVRISLRKSSESIELAIEDNGAGFDLSYVSNGVERDRGMGLASMRERAELSGGSFSIESKKGKGTIIRAKWGF